MVTNLRKLDRQSVQDIDPPELGQSFSLLFANLNYTSIYVPPWGAPARQAVLRKLRVSMYNTLTVSAILNLKQQIIQTAWEMSGGPRLTRFWTELFQDAEFGQGWDVFLSKVLDDYLFTDTGAFIEIIGPGRPDKPLKGRVMGIAHLDSLRCYPTGNPEYPVYFRPHRSGALHKLHWTRVYRLVDNPSPDPDHKGLGLCAFSRALLVNRLQELMGKYQEESLTDLPPKGMLTISGINYEQYRDVTRRFEAGQHAEGHEVFRNLMEFHNIDPDVPVKIELTPFSTMPEHFDYGEAMRTHVNMLALAIGVDPQDIWPLSGQAIGTGAQSSVLHKKGQGKSYGAILKRLERMNNIAILPESLEFKFKPADTDQDKSRAETAKAWADAVSQPVKDGIFDTTMAAELLANTVPEYADVLFDGAGNIRLPDDDRKPETEVNIDDEQTQPETPPAEDAATLQDTDTPAGEKSGLDAGVGGREYSDKSIQSTEIDFKSDVKDLIGASSNGSMTRRRAGVVMRALLSRHGNSAFRDGLEAGGVNRGDISEDDLATIRNLIVDANAYVGPFLDSVFASPITGPMIAQRVELWWNKSMIPFHRAGLLSADRNGYYEWELGNTEDHCRDCQALSGQIHRLKDWMASGWEPQSSKLECGGWNCDCGLTKRTNVRARGRLPRAA